MFKKKIIEKMKEMDRMGQFPVKKILDVKPRTEHKTDIIKFDVLIQSYNIKDIAICVAFEFNVVDWIFLYNGEAEYGLNTKTFVKNGIDYGSFTREMSQRWLDSIEFKLNMNGGI